jgi:hypothetical protein
LQLFRDLSLGSFIAEHRSNNDEDDDHQGRQ